MLNHVFTTPILRDRVPLSAAELAELRDYIVGLRTQSPGEIKSNRGGWHSHGNIFGPEHRDFPALRGAVYAALSAYLGDAFGFRGEVPLSLTGWSIVNRPGDYNQPHNHVTNLLSGALYIAVPAEMTGGAIVFQDPRLNLNAHDTEAMRSAGVNPPWQIPSISVAPTAGEILVFPSWLVHWVEPFACEDAQALRIVVSFNATVSHVRAR
jgi:uncharacterized protein (TIGR02466 family)